MSNFENAAADGTLLPTQSSKQRIQDQRLAGTHGQASGSTNSQNLRMSLYNTANNTHSKKNSVGAATATQL